MTNLSKILSASKPTTLAGAPIGFIPWLAADLARAAKGRAVFIAPDEAAMRHIVDAAHYFAPELETLSFPAWDCLPYDRSSPSLRSTSERLATLHALQRKTDKPQLLVTTVNAATQRTLTPFRIRQLVAHLAPDIGSRRWVRGWRRGSAGSCRRRRSAPIATGSSPGCCSEAASGSSTRRARGRSSLG